MGSSFLQVQLPGQTKKQQSSQQCSWYSNIHRQHNMHLSPVSADAAGSPEQQQQQQAAAAGSSSSSSSVGVECR
jgi:hypothetical protein